MSGLSWTWTYFNQLVGLVSPAVSSLTPILDNPIFYAVIIALLILSLIPWTK